MRVVDRSIINTNSGLYTYFRHNAELAKLLYNAALFRIRQIFTGWDKEKRTANEQEVFTELEILHEKYPAVKVKRVIGYRHLLKLMIATKNPDYYAGLPMQTAEAVVKQVCQDFKNWLAALKDYRQNKDKYTGKPRMPQYKREPVCTYTFTNQDAVLYEQTTGSELKMPLTKIRYRLPHISADSVLKEVKVTPYYGRFILSLTFEAETTKQNSDMPNFASIDFGTDNIAAIVCTDHTSRLYKGGAVLSENQWFAKEKARMTGILTKGKTNTGAFSKQLENKSFHHANFIQDQMHKISRSIIDFCLEHKAGTLVLGVNKNWKQESDMGRVSNQKFVSVPHTKLRQMIEYKAAMAGITVVEQEESYTSKADFIAGDFIPVYGQIDKNTVPVFSGRRIKRGLYKSGNGMIVNADLNGAANILRKAIPAAWEGTKDYSFLATPDVSGFHELNPRKVFRSNG